MNGAGTRCFMGDRSSHKVWESNYSSGSWGTETEIISESSFSGYWPASLSTDSAGETVCIKSGVSGNGAIYERAGNGSWSASVSGILSKTEVYGADKVALSYDGTMALFGHMRDSGALSTGGHALLYTKSGSTWTLTQTLLNPSSSQDSNDFFGGGTGLAKTVKDRFVVAAMGDDNAGTNYGAIYTYTNAIPDFISFDTYNKLSLSGITNPTSKIHALPTGAESTTTYDIGSATNIYIESAGTYTAEMKGSSAFALDSNVVTGLNDPVYITPKLDGGAIYIQGALDNAGGLYLCGLGSDGQLGQGNTTNSTNYVKVKGVGGSGFLENIVDFKLGPGNGFVIACDSSGKCYAWGNNSDGQLGQGNTTVSYTPLQVKGVGGTGFLENIINVSCGHYHSLACDSSGNAYAWGDNYYNSSATQGQLGDGTTTNKTTPIRVLGVGGSGYLTNIIQVAGKPHASQALSSSGHVYCWGANRYGECGDGTTTNRLTAVQVIGVGGTGYLSGITKLAGGDGYYADCGLALGSNGRVYAWGYNAWGQLGVGNTTNSSTPQLVKGVGGTGYLENIIDVACGGYHCFALDSSGTVYAWGDNSSGAPIGDGTTSRRTTPVKVKGVGGTGYLSNIVAIGGERFGGSAMDADGNVYAWSGNQNYQVGDGTNTTRRSPVRVLGVGGSGFLNLKVKPVAPSLNFDGYNKYTFTGADTGSTYKLKYESNTYDLGTISNVYIAYPGTYSAEIKGATNFALSSNVTGTVSEPTISGPVSIEWASLNYSNFDGSGGKAAIGTTGGILVLDGTFNTSATSPYVGTAIDITGASTGDHNFKYTIPFKPKSQSFELSFKASQPSSGTTFQVYLGYLTLNWSTAQGWNTSGDSRQKVVNLYAPAGSTIYLAGMTGQSLNQSSYTYDSTKPFVITSDTSTLKIEHNGNSKSIDLTATHEDSSGGTVADPEYYLWMAFDENSSNGLYNLSDVTYSVGGEVIKAFPTLSFDGYNKLSFSNIAPTTSNVTFDGNTYSIGTASNVYIENTGTYEAESKGTTTFALTSNVVGAINTDFPKPEGNVWDFTTTSSLTEPFYNSSLTKTGTMTHSGTSYQTSTSSSYLEYTFPPITSNVLIQFDCSAATQRTSPFYFSDIFQFYKAGNDYWRFQGQGGNFSGLLRISSMTPTHSTFGTYSYFFEKTSSTQVTMYYYANGVKQTIYNESATGHTLSNGGIVFPISDINNVPTIRIGINGQNGGNTSYFSNVYIEMEQLSGRVLTTDLIGTPDWFGFSIPPSLTHDGYKLVVKNITPTSTTFKYFSNTYEIGSVTNIYVKDTGVYSAEIGGAADFALTSNTVSGTIKTIEPVLRAGYENGHALTYDGKLYAWGRNTLGTGELGVGDASNRTVPTLCTGITQGQVEKFLDTDGNAPKTMTWIKTTDNKIHVTGNASLNQIPGHTTDLNTFTDVTSHFGDQSLSSNNIIQICFGGYACAGLTETGNVWTWGQNNNARGNLGNGGTTSSTQAVPAQITFSGATDNITKLANGHDFTIALDNESNVWLWGTEWLGNTWGSASPIKMGTALDTITVTDISASYSSMYAISNTGVLYASGNGGSGQIMDGLQTNVTSSSNPDWKEVTYFSSNLITVNKVYPGTQYAGGGFVDTSDGWYAFGVNGTGNLGLGDTANKLSPVKFTGVSNIKKFAVGYSTSHAVTEDGKYYAWGSGTNNARGDNNTGAISYPKYIDTLPNILAPSFEFDGYDKVFVGGTFVYEFYVSVKAAGSSGLHYVNINQLSSSTMTLKSNMVTVHVPSSGSAADMFDGSNSTYISINDPNHEVGTKLWTLVTDKELADLTFVADRPVYMPGWKITCNGKIVLNDTTNGSTSTTPSPATFTKTLSPITSLTKYTKGTTTYDAGKASIITVPDTGTYDAQLKKSGVFSLKSATVPATSSSGLYTWAFHHGNFDNAYGDGDILTARDNGRFYADTPAYTSASIGTITPSGTPSSFVYEFFISVQLDGGGYNEWNNYGITTTSGTLTQSMLQIHPTTSSGGVSDMLNGSNTSGTLTRIADGNHPVGTKIMTLTSPFELSDITFYPFRPLYQPGYKIVLNGNIILNETTNGGTSSTPSPTSFTKTLPVNANTTYTFTPASTLTANVLMVAGGGGGGGIMGGGGGAGGLVFSASETISGTQTIVVGNGGDGAVVEATGQSGWYGNDTNFLSYVAAGGGGGYSGGAARGYPISKGGSGGGYGSGTTDPTDGDSTQLSYSGKGFGNAGGSGGGRSGGGGGGAGTAGQDRDDSSSYDAGAAGQGKNYASTFGTFYGESGWFSGGGGGGGRNDNNAGAPNQPSTGGKGGGGSGTLNTGTGSQQGRVHTGGGGGGSGYNGGASTGTKIGGSGGSGIVLLQTNVATPNVNSEVKIPEPHYHVLIEKPDDTHFSHLPSLGSGNAHTSGSIVPNIPRADGSVSNVYYATSSEYFYAEQAGSLVSSVEGVFYPIEQQRYDNILEIGHNSTHDVEFEMAADGTAKLYRNNGGTHLASSTVKCFTVGKWHHIALTLDANRNAVGYVNGYPVVSTTYASAILPGSRNQMCLYRTGVTATFRKFLMYYFKTYNSVLNQNQILKLASSVGLGPKLEYDGLNTIKILNTEPGSSVKLFTSNVADTSNVFIVADPAAGEYTVPESGKYYAEIKGTDTFTITKTLDVSGTFPLYAYPPRDGTHSSITTTQTVNQWDTWTISGAANGNGQYQARSNHQNPSATRTSYSAFKNDITPGAGEHNMGAITGTRHLDLQLPSAKTIRKYIIWLTDSAFYTGNTTTTYTQYDPVGTMAYNGNERGVRRIKSWTIQGSNNDSDWTTIHTVTNKPPSNFGDLHTISSPGSYQYYRIAVTEHMGSSQNTMIGELIYYGDA